MVQRKKRLTAAVDTHREGFYSSYSFLTLVIFGQRLIVSYLLRANMLIYTIIQNDVIIICRNTHETAQFVQIIYADTHFCRIIFVSWYGSDFVIKDVLLAVVVQKLRNDS